ncbi:MAG TPA: DUF6159 family protein [Solirubrobacterales bacterium]|jgi:hypothetical protein|nr:DUF6159 family protein [Solirubrobacterales bacterium]
MSRIRRGWGLTKKSCALMNQHRVLIRFPLYGAVATALLAIAFLGPGLYLLGKNSLGGAIPLIVIGVYILSVVGFYFSVGLAAAADMTFRGQQASVADGLAVARSRFSQICGWAAIATTVSVVIGTLERQGVFGEIVARLFGVAWALVAFLAVPVIAIEGTGPLGTMKRSASMFRERWGQQITGNIAIRAVVFLVGVFPAILVIVAGLTLISFSLVVGAVVMATGILLLALAILVSRVLSGVFGVALYRYATNGQAVGGFTSGELESAVRARGGRRATPPGATPGTV